MLLAGEITICEAGVNQYFLEQRNLPKKATRWPIWISNYRDNGYQSSTKIVNIHTICKIHIYLTYKIQLTLYIHIYIYMYVTK